MNCCSSVDEQLAVTGAVEIRRRDRPVCKFQSFCCTGILDDRAGKPQVGGGPGIVEMLGNVVENSELIEVQHGSSLPIRVDESIKT